MELAKERRRNFRPGQTADMIAFWELAAQKGERLNELAFLPGRVPITRILPPRLAPQCDNIRVFFTARVNYRDPSGNNVTKDVGFSFDTARRGSVGDIVQEAVDIASIWRSRYYQTRTRAAEPSIHFTYVHCV